MLDAGVITTRLSVRQKLVIRRHVFRVRKTFTDWLFSYGRAQLAETLRRLGVQQGDTVFMHSSFTPLNGFTDGPRAVIDTVLDAVGTSGNLMMVSMPYRGSSEAYLATASPFDVRRSISRMGLVTELFRRRPGVERSLSPTHPILAFGAQARWLTAGHEKVIHPCGPGSPFEKALDLDGKALLFDVPFRSLTFFHYVEHTFREFLPVPLYEPDALRCEVIDAAGSVIESTVRVFHRAAREARESDTLERVIRRRGALKASRVGNTRLAIVRLADVMECAHALTSCGQPLYRAAPGGRH